MMHFKCIGVALMLLQLGASLDGAATPSLDHSEFLQHHKKDEAKQGIVPELDPISDTKFFKKDYPDDYRPGPYNHFGYPYPTVQDSDRYDKDYVKDENDDGGYWKAQMDYDAIRNKLTKEKEQLRKALAKEHEEQMELEKAKDAEKKAEAEAVAAEKAEDKAEASHEKAEADLEGLKSDIDEAADHTDGEITDLEECKKQLAAAKAQLKEELAEKAKREAAQKEREAHERGTEKDELDAMKAEAKAEKTLAEEQAEHEDAKKQYEKEKADVKAAEDELEAAYQALKKLRKADNGPGYDGGVYEVKSGSSQSTAITSMLLAMILASLFLI
eukprot:gnl/MRDRNA2_/MRDRNA2_87624_c0_seq1.p1 gnl/MRDRNA2_/MRDRNA2_87624_c0~~gnl/MRDRNA2_/MRDRNA2_87624_c0_seq1.p1  ORF type:complete len:329 (-),score=130.69 gnl/MRDRNA2_/MRDRNA2_87624_c0_seq1:6-992(-)